MSVNFEERESAYERRLQSHAIVNIYHIDVTEFLNSAYSTVFQPKQTELVEEHYFIETYATFDAEFKKVVSDGNEIREKLYIQCASKVIDIESDLLKWFKKNIK